MRLKKESGRWWGCKFYVLTLFFHKNYIPMNGPSVKKIVLGTPLKFNSSPLKNDGWKTILSFWEGNFSGTLLNFSWVVFSKIFGIFVYLATCGNDMHIFQKGSFNCHLDGLGILVGIQHAPAQQRLGRGMAQEMLMMDLVNLREWHNCKEIFHGWCNMV